MSKIKYLAAAAAIGAIVGGMAVACTAGDDKNHTVVYNYGNIELKTEEVADGGTATEWIASRKSGDNYLEFCGWYTDKACSKGNEYDFSSEVTSDIKLYAKFENAVDIRLKGSYVTGWEHFTTPEYTMTYDKDSGTYKYSHEFIAGDSFMFYNFEIDENGKFVGLGDIVINTSKIDTELSDSDKFNLTSGNIAVNASGTYSFDYNHRTDKVVVTYSDEFDGEYTPSTEWYVAGGGITEPLKSSAYGGKLSDAQKLESLGDNKYSITLDLARGDMFQIVKNKNYAHAHDFTDLVDPKDGETVYFTMRGDNIRCEVKGNYTLTLTVDPASPLGDKIEWKRNGDIFQELGINYDVYYTHAANDWKIDKTDKHTTDPDSGETTFNIMLQKDEQFCFIYYETGTPEEEVGSYGNVGNLITGKYMASGEGASELNSKIGLPEEGDDNFLAKEEGFYTLKIKFTEDGPIVNCIGYLAELPSFEIVIKGPAHDGTWTDSEKYASADGKVEMTLELSEGEFGFVRYAEDADQQYGDYIGAPCLGTSGDANSDFGASGNNFVCKVPGTYRIVIDRSTGSNVVDFYKA